MVRRALAALVLAALVAGPSAAAAQAVSPAERRAIEQDCARLSVDYAQAVDFNDPDGLAALFTPDGVWRLNQTVSTGQAAIRDYLRGFIARKTLTSRHVTTNVRVVVADRDHAAGTAYVQIFHIDPDHPPTDGFRPDVIGLFHDQYVRTPEGWRFARRELDGVGAPRR
jgi:uncharacterized protein (TIGR02246 family)